MERPHVAIQNSIRVKMTLAAFLVFVFTFFCYRNTLYNEFVSDDVSYILENTHITAINWENLKWMFTSFYQANWHPLTWLSLAIDHALVGLEPWGYHLTNIIFHALNTVLVLILTVILLKLRENYKAESFTLKAGCDERILFASLVAALLFGVHPQHVESVAWAAERKDVLSFFFTLLSLLAYISYAIKPRRRLSRYGLSVVFFTLALMVKPMAVTTPVLLLLLDIYPLHRTSLTVTGIANREPKFWQRIFLEKAPFFLLTLAVIVLTILAQNAAIAGLERYSMAVRLLNACNSIILYISKFLFPINLQPLYLHTPDLRNIRDFVPVLACILITLVCFYFFWKKQHYDSFIIWLFYLISLSPTIGIIQVGMQSSADRYAYLPTLPFYMVVGALISQLLNIRSNLLNLIGKISAAILILILGGVLYEKTQQQIAIWKNAWVLWNYAAYCDPYNGRVQAHIGRLEYAYGRYDKAIERFRNAEAFNMLSPHELHLWALASLKVSNLDESLKTHLLIINNQVEIGADKGCFYYNLACMLLRRQDIQEAQKVLRLITADMPKYQQAQDLATRIADSELDHNGAKILPSCQFCEHN